MIFRNFKKDSLNKKGLSPVVATILLVLLTVFAIGVISAVLIPFFRDKPNEATECFEYRDYFQFQEKFDSGGETYRYNCYQLDSGGIYFDLHGFSVKALNDPTPDAILSGNIAGFDLRFVEKTFGSEKISIRDGNPTIDVYLINGDTDLEIPNSGEVRTYVYEAIQEYDKVEIYPVLQNGRLCDKSDEINFIDCNPGNVDLGANL